MDEIELHSSLIDEGIACLLHTILIVRAPGNHFVSPSPSFLPSFLPSSDFASLHSTDFSLAPIVIYS